MNRYNTKESSSLEKVGIPSISNKKINLRLLSENCASNKKLIKDTNKSRSTQNLTLKALNDLSLYVVNIPSMKDIKKSIDDYYTKNELKSNKIPTPFVSPINFTSVKIQFPNEEILNGYKTYILFLKYEDPKFKQIVVKKENLFKTIKKIKLKSLNLSDTSNTERGPNLNENKEKKIIVKNIIKLYQKNQRYLRNSSPYFSEEDKRLMDERESRKKFMTPKGFCVSVGKYSFPPRYISNYVQMTPSENPLTYRFRPVNKLKWMTKKGFINA